MIAAHAAPVTQIELVGVSNSGGSEGSNDDLAHIISACHLESV